MANSINELFTQFLIDNNAYSQFITNLLEYKNCSFDEHVDDPHVPPMCDEEEELINYAFYWDNTPEGFGFWNDLDVKWRDVCVIN